MKTLFFGVSLGGLVFAAVACSSGDADKDTKTGAKATEDETSEDSASSEASTAEVNASEETGEGAAVDTSLNSYDATDERIRITARVDDSGATGPRFSSAGGYMTVRFKGDGISVNFGDQSNGRSSYDAWIDGAWVSKITPMEATRKYPVASGLEPGEHTLVFSKRTEASIGRVTLFGVEVAGTLLEAPAASHRIEFIGDSITAGAGVEGANGSEECSDANWGLSNNATASYGAVAARALDADYHLTAVSGIGLVRNYSAMYDARPMPEVYDLLYIEAMDSANWDHAAYTPEVVVVALGTNDFSPGDNAAEDPRPTMDVEPYTEAYVAFVDKLRKLYPEADIFGISSPMLGDGWPNAEDTSKTNLLKTLENVEAHYADAGDDKVHTFVVESLGGNGCGTHPDAEQHAQLGSALADEIRSVMNW